MAKPVAKFDFIIEGLSVKFTDSSFGVPIQWYWEFGFTEGEPPTIKKSTEKNPQITFPNPGIYAITLVATNIDGPSEPFIFNLAIDLSPGLNLTIADMVKCSMPMGLAVDSLCFKNSIRTWQLYLQPFMGIADIDVFNEINWPPLANVLISKLITYDIIMTAAKSSMSSYYIAMKLQSSNNTPTSTTTQVADYTYNILFDINSTTIIVNNLLINGIGYSFATPTNLSGLLVWMNSLAHGIFFIEAGNIKSLGNNNFISTLNITTSTGAYNSSFEMGNLRVIPITTINEVSSPGQTLGPLKYIETGPSKTEWYDYSNFWANMFSSKGNSKSLMETVIEELCMWAARLGVKLPMCPQVNNNAFGIRIAGRKNKCSCIIDKILSYEYPNKPPSMG